MTTSIRSLLKILVVLVPFIEKCRSFTVTTTVQKSRGCLTCLESGSNDGADVDRRNFGVQLAQVCFGTYSVMLGTPTLPALAYAQEDEDKEKIKKGYKRLSYLLDNWVAETTVCGKSDDNPYTGNKGCERTPLIVMDYMGYKSTTDPLFKADKTLKRLSVLVSAEDGPEYLDAMEKWTEAAEEASGMAYVSSWGEANPGGGKDRVELFIERAKKNVVDARESLGTAMRILGM